MRAEFPTIPPPRKGASFDGGGEFPMTSVRVKEGESFERAMRRFKKMCERSGILGEIRKREYYEKPSVKKKKKAAAARKRLVKKLRKDNG